MLILALYPNLLNVSYHENYISELKSLLEEYNVSGSYITLEVLESTVIEDIDIFNSILTEVKKLGFSVSLDDFGSGYSSLNMLKDVPFDVIKIDREFFSESITSNSSILILRKIIEMAEGLGIRVLCGG